MQNETYTLDKMTVETLVNNMIYRLLITTGRSTSLDKIESMLASGDMTLPKDLVKRSYDFMCDLYDDNEANGGNDEMYPNRVK